MEVGIMPHIIACRASNPVKEKVREKISMYTNVPMKRVVTMHDVESIYTIPESLREAGIDREVLTLLDLHDRVDQPHEDQARLKWRGFVDRIGKAKKDVTIAVTGKYTAVRDAYASIIKAGEHCGVHLGVNVNFKWLDTTAIDPANVVKRLGDVNGIIVPGGFGVRGTEGKNRMHPLRARKQSAVSGFVFGLPDGRDRIRPQRLRLFADAHSTEFDKACKNAVIDILPEQKMIEGLGGKHAAGRPRCGAYTQHGCCCKLFNNAATIRLAIPSSLRSGSQVHRQRSRRARNDLQRPASKPAVDADSWSCHRMSIRFTWARRRILNSPAARFDRSRCSWVLVKAAMEHAAKAKAKHADGVRRVTRHS